MEPHFTLSDAELETQFAKQTLDPTYFSHEAHLRLAWIHIRKYGIENAIRNITRQIKEYADGLGAKDKYNETVTIAAMRAVYHFMLRSKEKTFKNFIQLNPRLKFNFRELMDAHYSTNIFKSQRAKEKYLEPERLPFD
jgi:hypothetical protein